MRLLTILFFIFLSTASFSQELQATFDYKVFNIPGEGPYIETHLNFDAATLHYKSLTDSTIQASVETVLILQQGDSIVDFRKLNITSPVFAKQNIADFLDVQRFALPNGQYTLEVNLRDLNKEGAKKQVLNLDIDIQNLTEGIYISDITFLKSYSRAEKPGQLTKSGYDMVPFVSNYIASHIDVLPIYAESYNSDKYFGEDEMYVLTYFIEDAATKEVMPETQKFVRQPTGPVNPILHLFDVSIIPTGQYNVVVEMRNKQNEVQASKRLAFERANFDTPTSTEEIAAVAVEDEFVDKFTDRDTLQEYINSLWPIASKGEQISIESNLQSADLTLMQQYFYMFWERRDPDNPEQAWEEYKKEVQKVEEAYGTRIKRGYQSDRGRIYLKYGPPNSITQRHNDLDAYPYEIWHYYKLDRFNNRRFIFWNRDLATNDFEMLHSDVPGYIKNKNWSDMLRAEDHIMMERDRGRESRDREKPESYYLNPR